MYSIIYALITIFQRAFLCQAQTGLPIHPFPPKNLETRELVYHLKRLSGVSFCVVIMNGKLGRANTNARHDVISQNECFTCAYKIQRN